MKNIDFSVIKELNNLLKTQGLKSIRIKMGDDEIEVQAHPHATTDKPVLLKPTHTAAPTASQPSINSPMIGTAYLAPNPDAKPFIEVGQHVEPGQVVCIIEAMKMFTKIKADHAGTVSKIFIENQQPVEFGQPLFEITPHV